MSTCNKENHGFGIKNKNSLTMNEKYAILMSHTNNVNYNSFAAEVEWHAEETESNKANLSSWYERAVRADMAISDEIEHYGLFDEYYDLNSDIVKQQELWHGKK